MKPFILFTFLLYGQPSFAQSKAIDIPFYDNATMDTSLWFKDYSNLSQSLKLKDLKLSSDKFHFRFWTDIQAIDIWTTDTKTYFGMVTNFAQRVDKKLQKKGQYKIDKIFFNTVMLDSTTAKNIYSKIDSLQIIKIPSDGKINGWQPGFDGYEYLIETSDKLTYAFKTYWSPAMYTRQLVEADKIQKLADYLFIDLKIGKLYEGLDLPEGNFKRNGIQGVKIRTYNEQKSNGITIFDLL